MQQSMMQTLSGCPSVTGRLKETACTSTSTAAQRPVCSYQGVARRLSHFSAGTRSQSTRWDRRNVVVSANRNAPVKEPWWEKNNPPNMKTITSVQEFVDELAAAGDKLVIVDFYAKWCNACRALFPKLCQICTENPDIVILKVDFDENRDTVKPLGIKVLPFFHFYRGSEGRVAAFSASVGKIQRLRDALAEHSTPRCSLGKTVSFPDFPDITPRAIYSNNVVLRHPAPSVEVDTKVEAMEPAPV